MQSNARPAAGSTRQRQPLVNYPTKSSLDYYIGDDHVDQAELDYVTSPGLDALVVDSIAGIGRAIPLIPLDKIMLIETLGAGRISTIYQAA